MEYKKVFTLAIVTIVYVCTSLAAKDHDPKEDVCTNLSSCSSCLTKSYCAWCVTKSKCTKQSCGNDNIIYPKHIKALMSGPQFCPRIVGQEEEMIFESGKKQIIVVKITQIYLYMAFTPWRCRIDLNGEETVVNAVLIADEVYCDSAELINGSSNPYVEGTATVMWEQSKAFDGSLPFKVCRCDLDPNCVACN